MIAGVLMGSVELPGRAGYCTFERHTITMAKRKTSTSSIVAEPAATYVRRRPSPLRRNQQELAEEVVKPMPKQRVRQYMTSGVLDAGLLMVVLNIGGTQLRRRLAGQGTMAPGEAERVTLAEDLVERGTRTFGDREVFMAWLGDESPGLGGKRPMDLIRSITGMHLVMDELLAIEHGMPL